MMRANFHIIKSKIIKSLFLSVRQCTGQTMLKSGIPNSAEEVPKVSMLFVPGRKSGEIYQIVKPFIDPDYLKGNLGLLKLSCDHRGINLDLEYALKLADQWQSLKNHHSALVEKIEECDKEIICLDSTPEKEKLNAIKEEKSKLILQINAEKDKIYNIEDLLMPLFQKIPHFLHHNTPLQLSIMDTCKVPVTEKDLPKSHTEIAKNMIIFPNSSTVSYFLNGKVALLEYAIQSYFLDKMLIEGFCPLSCVDFCKSFVTEAVGHDPYSPHDCIMIKEKKNASIGQQLHLVGGASLESLCAFVTNMNIAKTNLPLRYFSVGRRYNAANCSSPALDLFSVVQSVNVHNMHLSDKSVDNEFDGLVKIMLSCYSELDLPFRTVKVAAKNLNVTESRRTDLELWAPAVKDFVPVAYVSQHDDFISKRLSITYGEEYKKEGFCNLVEGALCNIPVVVGCIVENLYVKENDFNIPDALKKYST